MTAVRACRIWFKTKNNTWSRVKQKAKQIYSSAQTRTREFLVQNTSLIKGANDYMPAAIAVLPLIAEFIVKFPIVFGICWEISLKDDVANLARQRILKDLTKLDEFKELIEDVEPALRDALGKAMGELNRLERNYNLSPAQFQEKQEEVIQLIEKEVWETLEPKIQDAQKKARLRNWIDAMKAELSEVDEIQQRAADILRENVREILYDFNEKAEDHLGQGIPGEIEGNGGDKAMHILAENIVDKIMDKDLDFDIAMGQIVAEIGKSGVLDIGGQEKVVSDLLKDSKTDDGSTDLKKLFTDFRSTYLDPGAGTLHLPREVTMQTLDRTRSAAERLTIEEEKEDGESN